jgi:23S rRNA pseudouridine2605 synthase
MQNQTIRLQHYLAQCGIASRRECEALISGGKIQVNGAVLTILGTKVIPGVDKVRYKNREVKPLNLIYIILNKPAGYTSTRKDRWADHTVMELLPPELKSIVYPVGRLDRDSRGLMLFTNDGQLALKLTHPRFAQEKEYRVTVRGEPGEEKLAILRQGIKSRELNTAPAVVHQTGTTATGVVLKIILQEGQNREIRRMLAYIGISVSDLMRVRLGKLRLGNLKPGAWRYVKKEEII